MRGIALLSYLACSNCLRAAARSHRFSTRPEAADQLSQFLLALTLQSKIHSHPTLPKSPLGKFGSLGRRSRQVSMSGEEVPKESMLLNNKRAYLINEPGFAQRFVGTILALSFLTLLPQSRALLQLKVLAERLEWSFVLGLLSSSCCALQLVLNLFSVGCAGFNTVLGPLRPYTLAFTVMLQSAAWRTALKASLFRPILPVSSLMCAFLSLLPEMLHIWVQRRDSIDASDANEINVIVTGMGCTACTAKVKSALEAVDGISSCIVNLEEGVARLRLEQKDRDGTVVENVVQALQEAGFGGKLEAS